MGAMLVFGQAQQGKGGAIQRYRTENTTVKEKTPEQIADIKLQRLDAIVGLNEAQKREIRAIYLEHSSERGRNNVEERSAIEQKLSTEQRAKWSNADKSMHRGSGKEIQRTNMPAPGTAIDHK